MKKYIILTGVLLLSGACFFSSADSSTPIPENVRATKIVVDKSHHIMTLYANDAVLRTYHVALGRGGDAAKQYEGDNRTPEGLYLIDGKNNSSQFYKSLHISYPSFNDVTRAKVQNRSPGGAVMIHGLRNDLKWLGRLHRIKDWTRGCIAVTNEELDEIWRVVPVGTPIEIMP